MGHQGMKVQPRRAALIAGLAAAAVVFGCYGVWQVPDRVVRLVGGATGVERMGGVYVRYQPPPGQETEIARRLGEEVRGRDGQLVLLEYPGLSTADEPQLRALLEQGGLRLREVLDGTPYVTSLHARYSDGTHGELVTPEVDQWISEVDGTRRTDFYLSAPTRQALEQAVADAAAQGLTPPEDSEVGYEEVEATPPSEWSPDGVPAHWRTYVLRQRDAIDGSMVQHARMSYDPNTNRPLVLIDLTAVGGQRLCDVTGQIQGSKLAILQGDKIFSAPIVNAAICGGTFTITSGSHDLAQQERQAQALAHLMTRPALPRGGRVVSIDEVRPASQGGTLLLARGLLALAGGVLAGLTVLAMLRWVRPRWLVRTPRGPGRFPWKRLGITLLAPLALQLGARVPLPGVSIEALLENLGVSVGVLRQLLAMHATMLGIVPLMSAFLLVEVVALAVPGLRWRRHDPRGRLGLSMGVAAATITLALVQGWFVARYLTSLIEQTGAHPGMLFHLGVAASLTCGTLLLALVAGVISEHGLGNGYGVLIASAALLGLGTLAQDDKLTSSSVPAGLALASTVAITWVLLRWWVDDSNDEEGAARVALRVPTSGLSPLAQGGGLLLVLGALGSVGVRGRTLTETMDRLERALASPWAALALTLGLTVLWSWLQARPTLLAPQAAAAGLPPPSQLAWKRATLLSAAASGTVALLYGAAPGATELASVGATMIATATVMDVIADARALRTKLVPAAVLHQVQRSSMAEHLLEQAGIPCYLRGAHLRTLLAFVGPYVPVIVLVPEAHGERARALLAPLTARPAAQSGETGSATGSATATATATGTATATATAAEPDPAGSTLAD